jgi:hypothetical protein
MLQTHHLSQPPYEIVLLNSRRYGHAFLWLASSSLQEISDPSGIQSEHLAVIC